MTATMRPRTSHPAKFPKYVLAHLELYARAEARRLGRPAQVFDPFAGVGRIHDLPRRTTSTIAMDIEPEWAACRRPAVVGDATRLPFAPVSFDIVATSPCYGSRMADHHEAKDSCSLCKGTGVLLSSAGCDEAPWCCRSCGRVDCVCGVLAKELRAHNEGCPRCRRLICKRCDGAGVSKRYTYRHALRRMPHERSAATLEWGGKYRTLHRAAWVEARRVLRPGGLILVNIKNHLRGGDEQLVAEWHERCLDEVGFAVVGTDYLDAPGLRHGANRDVRVPQERVIVGRA